MRADDGGACAPLNVAERSTKPPTAAREANLMRQFYVDSTARSLDAQSVRWAADCADHMIMWAKDVGRSVDYLESRADIAKDRIGYIGLSTGAALAPVFLAIEPRIKLGVIYMGGINLQPSRPEADTVNFARVKVPVLMLSGKFDNFYPTVSSQLPLFRPLGTPAEHKRRVEYDAAHNIPRAELIREVVNWLDKYWGKPTPR
jgi:cephalosporin-C deacetylase-like acetyl esterase